MTKDKIQEYLRQLASEKEIKILLACETGSRAWGFPSPDSDFDIRLLYVHKNDWYVSVNEQRDSIELMLEDNELDITGWELRKALNLLKKSNAALLERIQSPIIYQADQEFLKDIHLLANQCYSKIATLHHYLSMAKKMLEEMQANQEYKLKKFFYVLRTVTLCRWIIEKDEIPPIEFKKAYQHLSLEASIIERIDQLIALKSQKSESYLHIGEAALFDFIHQNVALVEKKKDSLSASKVNIENLNQVLRKYVYKDE